MVDHPLRGPIGSVAKAIFAFSLASIFRLDLVVISSFYHHEAVVAPATLAIWVNVTIMASILLAPFIIAQHPT